MLDTRCPKCDNLLTLSPDTGMFRCSKCGFRRPETLDEASERIRARGERPVVTLTYRGEIDLRARTLFDNGQDALWRGDKAAALQEFKEALEVQPDFVDAHLWIAKTSDDLQVQRDHLDSIMAYDPGHVEALRLLLVLKGELTLEEAQRSRDARTPILKRATDAVKTSITTLRCPVCGGDLTIDEANGRVACRFCGHTEALDSSRHASDGAALLGAALLKQRAQTVQWIVGERILHCSQCGAERTIPAGRLSTVCPFCGSTQVIQQDALHTIEQPDGLVPFLVSEEQAKAAIRARLDSVGQRIAGLLDDNRIAHAAIEGIYLPFWLFDALAEVSQTRFDRRTPNSHQQMTESRPYENTKFSDGMMSIPVAAVKSPTPALTTQLGEFNVSAAVAYDPKLLAKYPAALYDVDFDAAAQLAQGIVSNHMRQRYGQSDTRNVEVQVFTFVRQMSFTLLLLPVWVATLYERDGDVRSALVNGQTGQVALGKAQKANSAGGRDSHI